MHIFDARFPLAAKARRQEPDAPVADYRRLQQVLGLERVVVVQPTAYGPKPARDCEHDTRRCAVALWL